MKPGTRIVKIVMWAFFLGAVAYFCVYTSHVLFSSYETASLYSYTAEDTVETTGYMVRDEQVLDGGAELQEVVVAVGETVAVGDTLAVVYSTQEALNRHMEIKELESRLESLQYILSHSAGGSDNSTLNSEIIDAIVDLRAMTASGTLTELEDLSSDLKTLMFRRDYTYNGSSALTEEITELVEYVESLAAENQSYTTTISAPASGTFSSMVDGYESVLTSSSVKDLTPAQLDKLLDQQEEAADDGSSLGKLITSPTWYFAAELTEEDSERMKIGDTLTLRFNSLDRTVDMEVESISKADSDGVVCVVFSSNQYLAETTLLRDQTADIILDTVTGYRVDKSAVHVENESGDIGVYRLYGTQAVWVSVEILWEGEDYYLIAQPTEYDEEGNAVATTQLEDAKSLRAGVEIIVKGRDLYNGKVIE
ncbi:MAG: hypothetical protein LUD84_01460 [Clostridiales bacterium]|nr:hypothetical protein [Clostridiales bacterium]